MGDERSISDAGLIGQRPNHDGDERHVENILTPEHAEAILLKLAETYSTNHEALHALHHFLRGATHSRLLANSFPTSRPNTGL